MENSLSAADIQLKQLKQMRLQTILISCILVLVIAAGVFVIAEFSSIKKCVNMIEEKMDTIDTETINDAVDAFTDAADQFNSIDMDGFNDTVDSLKGAADNFSSVDIEKLNSLVESLDTVATKLENAVNAINRIFNR